MMRQLGREKSEERQSPGTGPFFGGKTYLAEKPPAENMDLSPSRRDFAVLQGKKSPLYPPPDR